MYSTCVVSFLKQCVIFYCLFSFIYKHCLSKSSLKQMWKKHETTRNQLNALTFIYSCALEEVNQCCNSDVLFMFI